MPKYTVDIDLRVSTSFTVETPEEMPNMDALTEHVKHLWTEQALREVGGETLQDMGPITLGLQVTEIDGEDVNDPEAWPWEQLA